MRRHAFPLLTAALLAAVPAVAADFRHDEHLGNMGGEPCTACHKEGARSIVPDLAVCKDCHEDAFLAETKVPGPATHGVLWAFQHRPAAKGSTHDCASCHDQKFCLECHKSGPADEQGDFGNALSNVHRSDFQVTHPIPARTDPQLCSSCHEAEYCSECHDEFNRADLAFQSHRRGWSDLTTSPSGPAHSQFNDQQCETCHPDSVLPSHQWSDAHGREARRSLVTCQACHGDGDVCLKCHSAVTGLRVNPHPDDWDDIKSRLKNASDGKTCRKCH